MGLIVRRSQRVVGLLQTKSPAVHPNHHPRAPSIPAIPPFTEHLLGTRLYCTRFYSVRGLDQGAPPGDEAEYRP